MLSDRVLWEGEGMPSSGSVSWEFVLSDRILWEREKDEQINTSHGRMLKSPESAKRESLRQNEDSSFSKPTWPSQNVAFKEPGRVKGF